MLALAAPADFLEACTRAQADEIRHARQCFALATRYGGTAVSPGPLAMHDVMQGPRGTARAVGLGAPYEMAGKSGTAQIVSIAQDEEYDEDEIGERQRDHALFISFAPYDDPRIAVAVIVENGGHGSSVAAPIARQIMDAFLLEPS